MRPTNQRDYYAEMHAAGVLADEGWNVYFPRRDKGFDFVITQETAAGVVVRPVQVKGKYPEREKGDKLTYGYRGELSLVHPDMVLIIPYFPASGERVAPQTVAYLPFNKIARTSRGLYRCEPAKFLGGVAAARRDSVQYFDAVGLSALVMPGWK
jgi:hypothetical protein